MKIRSLLCAIATALLAAPVVGTEARAYAIFTQTDYAGETLAIGDTVSVDIRLDTEGQSSIGLLSVGVLFDPTMLSLRRDLSSIALEILYGPGSGGMAQPIYLENGRVDPFAPWPGVKPAGLEQLNLDYVVSDLLTGTSVGTTGLSSDELMATLVFEIVGLGTTQIEAAMTSSNVLTLLDENSVSYIVSDQLALPAPITLTSAAGPVPEPSTALLVSAGMLIVAARVRRSRR